LIIYVEWLQGDSLNKYGELYIKRFPELKIKIVDGSSLVVAIALNSIPKEATQVLLCGKPNKVSYAIATALCERGTKVCFVFFKDLSTILIINHVFLHLNNAELT